MSDRIAVFNHGRIEQIGAPGRDLRAAGDGLRRRLRGRLQPARRATRRQLIGRRRAPSRSGPEKIRIAARGAAAPDEVLDRADGRVRDVTLSGRCTRYQVALDGGGELVVVEQNQRHRATGTLAASGRRVQPLRARRRRRSRSGRSRRRDRPDPRLRAVSCAGRWRAAAALHLPLPAPASAAVVLLGAAARSGSASSTSARCSRCSRRASSTSTASPARWCASSPSRTYARALHRRQPRHHRAHRRHGGGGHLACGASAFPLAYYMARYARPRAEGRCSISAVMLPLWSSYLVRVYSWKLILAKEGIVTWLFAKLHLAAGCWTALLRCRWSAGRRCPPPPSAPSWCSCTSGCPT